MWYHCTAWWGCHPEAWSDRFHPAASPSRRRTWGRCSGCDTLLCTVICSPLVENKQEHHQCFRLANQLHRCRKLLTRDQALGELTGVHFIVELVLGWTEVTQIFGYLGSLRDEGVFLPAHPTFDYKFMALMKYGGNVEHSNTMSPKDTTHWHPLYLHSRKLLKSLSRGNSGW